MHNINQNHVGMAVVNKVGKQYYYIALIPYTVPHNHPYISTVAAILVF